MDIIDYFDNCKKIAEDLKHQNIIISKIIKVLKSVKESGNQVFLIGNGGSASNATHMAADLFKMAGIKAISLADNIPLFSAYINDDGWEDVYYMELSRLVKKGDVLIAFSVHGGSGRDKAGEWSQNILRAIDYINNLQDGVTIGFSGFDGGAMKRICKYCVIVPAISTPLVESFHSVLAHLIAFSLQEGDRI
ncbi:MAG TPA: SIS domain-containing protein [Thermoplasmatales archaeon]|nr:SIS domain-containing protein [Thermoplasmatales archaeon]